MPLGNSFKSIAPLLALTLAGAAAHGQVASVRYEWHNVVIGGGGFSPNIIFSPAEKGLAYLRTDVGGAYRWDSGKQRWIPLQDSQWQNSYFGIESIAPDPKAPNIVYVAAGMYHDAPAAILRSADRGTTWTPLAPGIPQGQLDGSLVADPTQPLVFYAGTHQRGLMVLRRSTP